MPIKPRVDGLIERLCASNNLSAFLKEEKLSINQLRARLRAPRAKNQLTRWRALARMHATLLADHDSSGAVRRIRSMVTEENAALSIKASLALLDIAGIKVRRKPAQPQKPKGKQPRRPYTPEEEDRLITAVNIGLAVLDGRRALIPFPGKPALFLNFGKQANP